MSKQPKALQLADVLCYMADDGDMGRKADPKCNKRQAAAELRRLHEVNAELLEAMESIKHSISQAIVIGNDWRRELRLIEKIVDASIAKAEGETE